MVPSWLLWLVFTALGVMCWECGVTPEWESELTSMNREVRRLQPSRAFQRSETLGPLRIQAYYLDMSAFSPSRLNRIQQVIMPSVLSWFANVLSVYNLKENWVFPLESCWNTTVPTEHQTKGIPGVDIVIYISANNDITETYLARAGACAFDGGNSRGNPIAGTFEYNSFQYTDNVTVESEIATARHEITHILGYSVPLFLSYTQPDGSLYQNPVRNMTSGDTNVIVLTTPTVAAKARSAFGCANLSGIELESQGGWATAFSHPEKRVMFNDYMVGDDVSEPIYSDVTLAALDDSGWYRVNYDYTDQVKFGRGKGCGFFTKKCVLNGVAQFEEFCDTENFVMCDLYHAEKAFCLISTDISDIPTPYQYFLNPTTGGLDPLTEYCPYAIPYLGGNCKGRGSEETIFNTIYFGEQVCDTCKCFTGTYIKSGWTLKRPSHSGCHQVTCANGIATVMIGSIPIQCPATGGRVSSILGYDGYIDCPSYDTLCGLQVCINGCFGYGRCMSGTCLCNDGYSGIDCSTVCEMSCRQCSGVQSTQCTSCYRGSVLVSGTCVCVDGYVRSSTGTCVPCSSNCITCSQTPSSCLTCDTTVSVLSGNQCRCLSSAFLSSTGQCISCDSSCLTCSAASPTSCLTCAPKTVMTSTPGECLCASGFFPNPDVRSCAACDQRCKECSGSLDTMCTVCVYPAVLSSVHSCLCPQAYYPNPDASRCSICDSTCKTCSGPKAEECSSCFSLAQISATDLNTCVCQDRATPHPTSATCACDDGYTGPDCSILCDTSCKQCSGALPTQCASCFIGAVLVGGTCVCVDGYVRSSTGTCVPCSSNCITCSQTPTSCLTCDTTVSVLSGNQCRCLSSALLSSTGQCISCDPSCVTCSAASPTSCLTCAPKTVMTSTPGECLCASGFFPNPDVRSCAACDQRCKQCSGALPTQCASCYIGAVLVGGSCGCVDGYVLSLDDSCVQCSHNLVPLLMVGGVALFGFLITGLLAITGRRPDAPKSSQSTIELGFIKSDVSVDESNRTGENVSIVTQSKSGFSSSVQDLLGSHFLIGCVVATRGLERWMKSLIMTSSLLCEMSVVGVFYELNQAVPRDSEPEVWKQYNGTDLVYVLVALAAGLGVSIILLIVVERTETQGPRVQLIAGVVLGGVLSALAISGSVYMSLDLCYEAGGLWAIGNLLLLFGEVLICQVLLSVGRNLVLRLGS